MDFVFCMHIWKCVKSPTYDLSLLVTQRGLSLTEDMAVSSPTVPEPAHGKVGVKEGDIQRHIENEMETEEEEEGEAQWERREGGYDSQRRCLPFLCVTPKPWNEPIHDDCFSLYLISITGSAIPVHTVKWHLKIPVIEYGNGRGGGGMQTVDNHFVVQDQQPPHISTVITSQPSNTRYFSHDVNNNPNRNNTQVAVLPYALSWLIT